MGYRVANQLYASSRPDTTTDAHNANPTAPASRAPNGSIRSMSHLPTARNVV